MRFTEWGSVSQTSSSSSSPVKAKQKPHPLQFSATEVSDASICLEDTRELHDSIKEFPISDQPVWHNFKGHVSLLKNHYTFRYHDSTIQSRADITAVSNRVTHIEEKTGDFASTFYDLIDAHNEQEHEITWMKSKITYLEDHSRHDNVKIRGVGQAVIAESLLYWYDESGLTGCTSRRTGDRIHRLPKPKHIPTHLPRDTIACIHFLHTKENLIAAFRKVDQLPKHLQAFSIFVDLSAHTMQQQRQLATITKPLRNYRISYQLWYPAKLLITKDDHTYTVISLAERIRLLGEWNILDHTTLALNGVYQDEADQLDPLNDWLSV